jgi:hypothetical protein
MLSVIMLNVVMLNVTNNPFMSSVIMLNVVTLIVVAPETRHILLPEWRGWTQKSATTRQVATSGGWPRGSSEPGEPSRVRVQPRRPRPEAKPRCLCDEMGNANGGSITVWSDRYFALWTKTHGAQCCSTNPQKQEMIKPVAPPFWTDKTKELLLCSMIHEVLRHA